ncbi:serine/threonine-protein kinase [Streptomyces sp. V3I7]|uniref:serine/threonine-protein kinase n=1 Tax=Streptomyces sp. V3I7 TaxID=3042278 RepID=UPI0027D79C0D|nr:serine/threonine-protein kinase [Streptomyces sp. V3I7]
MLIAGRYRLHTAIGRGAMGEVWRAQDELLGRAVAVKLLLSQDGDPTAASRFRLEAETAGRLSHPHVVGVLDFGEQEGRLFLVMELVDGDSLAQVLSGAGTLPAEQVARMAAQAAAGLAVAHEQGIVHRDIKPGNLLVDADGNVKIGDFGIARFVDDPNAALTATGQIVGTSLYLAPERALGKPAGPPSDVYSLGCLLYQLLTGRPPFHADSAVAVLHQHLDQAPVPPRELGVALSPAFESYLLSLLAKKPEERPTARQAAEWFSAGAWRGEPEPLPAAVPPTLPTTARTPAPPTPAARHRSGGGSRSSGGTRGGGGARSNGGTRGGASRGAATVYALPSVAGGSASPHRSRRRQQRPSVTDSVRRRPRVIGTAAGAALFVAALLVGMAWFSPDRGAAETPPLDQPGTTAPAQASQPSIPPTAGPRTASDSLDENGDDHQGKDGHGGHRKGGKD